MKNGMFGRMARLALVVLSPLGSVMLAAAPEGTGFTYQGRLVQGGVAANGVFDLQFRLFNDAAAGAQVGSTLCSDNVSVSDGLFTVTLDFGGVFDGTALWLSIGARPGGAAGDCASGVYTTLVPRQPLTAAPYADFALKPWATSGGNISYTAGSVGIGTANPSNRLTVANETDANATLAINSGLSAAQFSTLRLNDRGNGLWSVNKNPSNDFSIREVGPGADRFYIAQGGNVGIGTSNPGVNLSITDPTGANDVIVALNTGTGFNSTSDTLRFNSNGSTIWSINRNSADEFTIHDAVAGRDRIHIDLLGNVGINTASPSNTLSVNGDQNISGNLSIGTTSSSVPILVRGSGSDGVDAGVGAEFQSAGGSPRFYVMTNFTSTNAGGFFARNSNGHQYISGTPVGSRPDGGALFVGDSLNFDKASMFVDVDSLGKVVANIKNFREPNPRDPATDIWYACVEGPEAAMYVRGTGHLVNGRATIALPEHFSDLASEQGMTVQLTPQTLDTFGMGVISKSLAGIQVGEVKGGNGNFEFDWEVKAVRKRHERYQVVRAWDDAMPMGVDHDEAWRMRLEEIGQEAAAVKAGTN